MRTVLIRASGCWHCDVVEHAIHTTAFMGPVRPTLIVDVPRAMMAEARHVVEEFAPGHRTYPALLNSKINGAYGCDDVRTLTLNEFRRLFVEATGEASEITGFQAHSPEHLREVVTHFLNEEAV